MFREIAVFGVVLGAAAGGAARGQDPTRMAADLQWVLQEQIAESGRLEIAGLVAAADGGGAALLRTGPEGRAFAVHEGSEVTLDAGGSGLPVRVTRVDASGVGVTAESLDREWVLATTFVGARAPASADGDADSAEAAEGDDVLELAEFNGAELGDAIRLLADQSGRNFVATAEASAKPVRLTMRRAGVMEVVEELCKSHGLWFRTDEGAGGTVRIMTLEEFAEDLASFQQEDQCETFTLLYPNVTDVAQILQGVYADRVVLNLGDEDTLDDELDDLSRRFERFNVVNDSGSSDLMGNFNTGSTGQNQGGGRRGGGTIYGGALYRNGQWTATGSGGERRALSPGEAEALTGVLARATEDAGEAGAAADRARGRLPSVYVTVARRSNILVVRTSDPRVMEEVRRLVERVDVPTPMVLLEVKVLELSLGDDYDVGFSYSGSGDVGLGSPLEGFAEAAGGMPGFSDKALSDEARRADTSGDGLTFQLVNSHFQARVDMMQRKGKARVVATPTLLTAHNEVSQLFIGKEVPIVHNVTATTVVSENGATVVTPETEVEFEKVGTRLLITPNINADRTVTLRLLQENSAVAAEKGKIPVLTATGMVEYEVDVIESRSIAGTFVAQDRLAIAAGGLIREEVAYERSGVPVLMDIPLLGWFFRTTTKTKHRTELVVMLTPHVISTPGEARGATEDFVDRNVRHPGADTERSKAGLRAVRKERREGKRPAGNAEMKSWDNDRFFGVGTEH